MPIAYLAWSVWLIALGIAVLLATVTATPPDLVHSADGHDPGIDRWGGGVPPGAPGRGALPRRAGDRHRGGRGLRVVVSGTTGESVATDMVTSVGGGGTAPSPGWLFRAAQASCVATLIRMRAEMLDVTSAPIQVTVDSESDDRGILGIDPDVVAGPLSTRVVVRLGATELPSDAVEAIVRWAVDHCPVTEATTRSVPMEIVIEG